MSIRTTLFKWLLGKQVKAALDALPFNGKKTAISVTTTIIALLIFLELGSDFYLQDILNVLINLGGFSLLSGAEISALVGAVATIVGLIHKVLKAVEALEGH